MWGWVRSGWGGVGREEGGGGSSLVHLPPPLSAHNNTPLGLAQKSMVNLLYLWGLDCWAFLLLLTYLHGPFELCLA